MATPPRAVTANAWSWSHSDTIGLHLGRQALAPCTAPSYAPAAPQVRRPMGSPEQFAQEPLSFLGHTLAGVFEPVHQPRPLQRPGFQVELLDVQVLAP